MGITILANRQVPSSTGGISRNIVVLSSGTTTADNTANIDTVYICNGTCTITLPTAVGNKNMYTIKNISGNDTINTTSSQTIDGSTSIVLNVENQSIDIISNNTNWLII